MGGHRGQVFEAHFSERHGKTEGDGGGRDIVETGKREE